MSRSGVTVARNFGALLVAQAATWGLTLILTIFLPRYLGVENVGKLYLATSIWMTVMIVAAFGADFHLTKAVSRDRSRAAALFVPALVARALLGLVAFLPVAAYTRLAGYPHDTVVVVLIIGLGQLFMQLGEVARAILQGLERMEYVSVGNVLCKLVVTAVTVGALVAGYGVYTAAAVTVGGGIVYFAALTLALARLQPIAARLSPDAVRGVLTAGLPYFLLTVLVAAYARVDIVILSLLADETTVGWYGAAVQLTGTFVFVATLLVTAMFPVLARTHAQDAHRLVEITRRSAYLLFLIGLPIGLGVGMIARQLVVLLFGPAFAGSGPVLAVMGLTLVLTYQNTLLGRVLVSADRQRPITIIVSLALAALIALDLVLVPWSMRTFGNGGIGGALAFLVTEVFILVASVYALPADYRRLEGAGRFARVALAGLVMLGVLSLVREHSIPVLVAVGVATYGICVVLLRLLPADDRRLVGTIVEAARGRLARRTPRPAR